MEVPLAERIRPQRLEDYISQAHLVGLNGSLTLQISRGIIPSIIFGVRLELEKLLWHRLLLNKAIVLFTN